MRISRAIKWLVVGAILAIVRSSHQGDSNFKLRAPDKHLAGRSPNQHLLITIPGN